MRLGNFDFYILELFVKLKRVSPKKGDTSFIK